MARSDPTKNGQAEWIKHRWGKSKILYTDDHLCLAEAHGVAKGASSLHLHAHKANCFIVHSGVIEIWGPHDLLAHLKPLDAYVSPAGEKHRMVFLTDAVLLEVYHSIPGQPLELDDIRRVDTGWVPGEVPVRSRKLGGTDSIGRPM